MACRQAGRQAGAGGGASICELNDVLRVCLQPVLSCKSPRLGLVLVYWYVDYQ